MVYLVFKTNHLSICALILLSALPHKHQEPAFTLFAFLCALLQGQVVLVCTCSVLPCIFVCLLTTDSSVGSLAVSSIERLSYGARRIITSWLGNWRIVSPRQLVIEFVASLAALP